MNTDFGNLTENNTKIEYAPSSLKIGNIVYSKPSKEQYLQKGYKSIIDIKPEPKDGFTIVFDKFTEDDENIYYAYRYDKLSVEEPNTGFKISKLYLRIALTELGIWEQVVEWMKSSKIMISESKWINMYDAFCDALVLDTSDELFAPYFNNAKEVFKDFISAEQIDQIFLKCKAI